MFLSYLSFPSHVFKQVSVRKAEFERAAAAAMLSSTYLPLTNSVLNYSTSNTCENLKPSSHKLSNTKTSKPRCVINCNSRTTPSRSSSQVLLASAPLAAAAASLSILLWSSPAYAGFLSGSTGLESIPGPELPKFDFLNRFNEENQKKYAEFDERFKQSPLLKKLLEQSKLNQEKNKLEIQDKYCLRGAEWGVGDCSTAGMTENQRTDFIDMLKKKVEEK